MGITFVDASTLMTSDGQLHALRGTFGINGASIYNFSCYFLLIVIYCATVRFTMMHKIHYTGQNYCRAVVRRLL